MIVVLIVVIIGVGLWRISHPYDKPAISEVSTKATLVHHMNHIDRLKNKLRLILKIQRLNMIQLRNGCLRRVMKFIVCKIL